MWWLTEVDFMAHDEKYKDLQREAARERLADEALRAQPAGASRKMLHWLGGQMIRFGTRLQR